MTGAFAVWPRRAAIAAIAIAGFANLAHPTDPRPPAGWVSLDTNFGPISHGTPSAIAEYRAAREIQQEALSQSAVVIVFPETVVPYWTASTDAFWEQTLVALRARGETIILKRIVGNEINERHSQVLPQPFVTVHVFRSEYRPALRPISQPVWPYFEATSVSRTRFASLSQPTNRFGSPDI
jgi:hypothetical protein